MAQNYTPAPAPPLDDTLGDGIVAEFLALVRRELEPILPRLGTVTSISGSHAQVSVQEWDDDAGGEQFRARAAGINFKPGDQVVLLPTGNGEYVVTNVIANDNAQKAVVGVNELENDAVRGRHVGGREITPAHLDRDYTTPAEANDISTNVTNAIVTNRQLVGLPTLNAEINQLTNHVNTSLQQKAWSTHTHNTQGVFSQGATLASILANIHVALVCLRRGRNSTDNAVCAAELEAVGTVT